MSGLCRELLERHEVGSLAVGCLYREKQTVLIGMCPDGSAPFFRVCGTVIYLAAAAPVTV